MNSKLDEEKKALYLYIFISFYLYIFKSLYIFPKISHEGKKYVAMMQSSYSGNCMYHYNIKSLNRFDQELQLINTKPITKRNFKKIEF